MTRYASLIVLAPAILSAALWARQNPPGAAGTPQPAGAAAVAEGQRLFSQTCQSCHGSAGQGSDRGPSLVERRFGPRRHGRRPVSRDSRRRARHPDAALPRVERHRSPAARRLCSQPASGTGRRSSGARVRRRRGRRSALLWTLRMRGLSRGERTRRDRGPGPVECRPSPARAAAAEDRRSERSVDVRGPRARRWPRRAGNRAREDARRTRDSRRAPQRGHVFAADGRCVRPTPSARQDDAGLCHRREHLAAPDPTTRLDSRPARSRTSSRTSAR